VGIEEIHKNGIVHRDIKPENCLINSKGYACLADFGLAKEGLFEEYQTDTMLGGGQTYQIPEVLKEQSYGKSVDIYLFGLLMYEVLTGCAAFPCFDDLDEHEERIKNCEFCFPGDEQFNARCKKYSGYLDADRCNMLMSSLAKDLISNLIKSDSK